ncbi:hypothetical protein [Azospirillum sp. TSO35-2]|uniref:hypothetical protein n=1 Tax=Azospirillum sp. TSO35-2 TaxID=716796 RepID=UPI000D607C16|nr:hypothetical protein [Azospirillum sp. TSO35-2]PWC32968.1 hypothetical protein TSO352_20560 [Azospirillum sp. TSO35-2]
MPAQKSAQRPARTPIDDRFAEPEALLLEHRRLVAQAHALLARPSSRVERLALADDLITLIDRLNGAKRLLADRIRMGRAVNTAVSAYGRAGAYGRNAPGRR